MSVHWSSERKRFFICYKIKREDGSYKTVSVYNRNWTKERGKRYVERIEEAMVKDSKRQKAAQRASAKSKDVSMWSVVDQTIAAWRTEYKFQTAYHKEHILEKYIKSYFARSVKAKDALTPSALSGFRRYVSSLSLTAGWKNKILLATKQLVDKAGEADLITFERVTKCKNALRHFPEALPKERLSFWTDEEWSKFVSSFDEGDPFRTLFLVTYVCGLRLGELLALTWRDFDPNSKTISINKAIDNAGNVSTPKNYSSNGIVSIPRWLSDELTLFMRDFAASPEDWMFFPGRRTSRTTIRRVMKKHIDISGVPFIRFHGLRHSCASHLIHAGMGPLLVAKHLRHASVKETLDTYSHLFPNETSDMVESLFSGKK